MQAVIIDKYRFGRNIKPVQFDALATTRTHYQIACFLFHKLLNVPTIDTALPSRAKTVTLSVKNKIQQTTAKWTLIKEQVILCICSIVCDLL